MPSWYIKAGIQGLMSFLPRSHALNYIFQRYVSRGLVLKDNYFEDKLKVVTIHLENYRKATNKTLPQNVLELGTGWLPIVPIALYLCGIEQIYTIDKTGLTYPHLVKETLDHFITYAKDGRLSNHLPVKKNHLENLEHASDALDRVSIAEALQHLNITLLITDARSLGLEDNSIEFFVSNNTFEHIPLDVLSGIMQEFNRISTYDGINSHFIDLEDHYSQFDSSISSYNFLRYSDGIWRFFNNDLQYQNRLRVSDYREIHERAGFQIIEETNKSASQTDIEQIQLAKRFESYAHEDVIVIKSFIVSQPKRS